jgi:hypothetical protein
MSMRVASKRSRRERSSTRQLRRASATVVLYVESLPPQEIRPVGARAGAEAARAAVVANPAASSTQDIRAQAAGFANEADRLAVRRMRFGR